MDLKDIECDKEWYGLIWLSSSCSDSSYQSVTANDSMIVNNKLEVIWKETILKLFNVLSQDD
jgi:hypothetical protein